MNKMEKTKNSFNQPIGEWKLGDEHHFISFSLTHKPNFFRRLMAYLFFGLKWIDYPHPKHLSEVQPSKGMKLGKSVQGAPQKGFKG